MARLIVEAVPAETSGVDLVGQLQLFVSVSRASDGTPVTGLVKESFRISSSIGLVIDPTPASVSEAKWEPGDTEPSGCYRISIRRGSGQNWTKGERYCFGIQARVLNGSTPVDVGQAAVVVESLGT